MVFPKFWTQSDIDWSFYPMDFTQNPPNDSSHHIMMFPMFWTQSDIDWSVKLHDTGSGSYDVRSEMEWFWTQSDIDWSVKLHDSGSYDVRSEMEWLFYPLDFTQNTPIDSPHHIMMFPKFWTQSDIDWPVKLDDSGSCDVRSEMEWLMYCIVLSVGFHPKHTK
ncbi:unnamed protein product [Prunus armeniaca]